MAVDGSAMHTSGHDSASRRKVIKAPQVQRRYLGLVGYLRFSAYLALIVGGTACCNIVILLSAGLVTAFSRSWAYRLTSLAVGWLWRMMQSIFERRKKARVSWSGDDIPRNESAIVMANHTSWSDFYGIQGLAARRGMLPYCRYFVKDSLKYLPFFGWAMYFMGMILVKRQWQVDQASVTAAFQAYKRDRLPIWLVTFVEGTRRTPAKVASSQAFCKAKGLPQLDQVLWPRHKGLIAAIQELKGSHVEALYDFTLAYDGPDGFQMPPDLITIHALSKVSPPFRFHVHVRRYALQELPEDDARLAQWIEERWVEKNTFLNQMQEDWTDAQLLHESKHAEKGVRYEPL